MIYNPAKAIFYFREQDKKSWWAGARLHAYTTENEYDGDFRLFKTKAVIEDDKTGEVFTVPVSNIRFKIPGA